MQFGFGVDLGGTTVKIACFNREGNMLDKWEIPTVTAEGGAQILPDIAASVLEYIKKNNIPREKLLGIGIGVPGPVDNSGVVNGCVNLGWGVFNIQQKLSELTGLPVKASNDANVAALGECWAGGGKGYENLLFVTLGTGVGGGIVLGGKILNGTHGSAGEIGHMVLDRSEPEQGPCGNYGGAEYYCSATGIVRVAKRYLAAHQTDSPLAAMDSFVAKDVFDLAKAGDKACKAILEIVYSYLGQLIANVCNVINPQVVILGGGVSKAGQCLIDGVVPYFMKDAFPGVKQVEFALAQLGNDAGAYGAFKLLLD